MVRLSIACAALATTLAVAAHDTGVAAQDFKLHGVNYNVRAGADWEPEATKCKSAATVAQELATLKRVTDIVRIYSLTDCNQGATVLPAAVKAGLKVSLGLWVGPEPATFAAEKAKFQELLTQDGLVNSKDVVGIHVGSEAIYRGDVTTDVAIANFNAIKQLCKAKKLDIPVTIADIGDVYLEHPELVDAVDVVSANAFPFWEKIDADKAAAYLYKRLTPLIEQAAAQKKEVVIGETGWATAGVHANASDATPANAATYFRDFYTIAQQHKLKYYYFAGFDEQWKIATSPANSTVEAYFGLFTQAGELKSEYKALTFGNKTSPGSAAGNSDMPTAGSIHAGSLDTISMDASKGNNSAGKDAGKGNNSASGGAAGGAGKGSGVANNNNTDTKQNVVVPGMPDNSKGKGGSVPSSSSPAAGKGSSSNPAKQSSNKRKDCNA